MGIDSHFRGNDKGCLRGNDDIKKKDLRPADGDICAHKVIVGSRTSNLQLN